MPRYNPVLLELETYPQQALNQRKAKVLSEGKTLYDFGVGDPQEPVPLFIREALQAAVSPHCGYPNVAGPIALRKSIVGYLKRRYDLDFSPEKHVIPTSGAKEAVFHAPLVFIDPRVDDRYIVFPDPGYPAYMRGAKFAGAIPYSVSLDGDYIFRPWLLDEELLRKTRVIWLNSPHNPSGVCMSLDDLHRTADVCRKYDIVCISDETYADIYHQQRPHSILECGLENVLAIHSLSKRSGMTGYRSGFLVGDPVLIAKFKKFRSNPGLVPQNFVNAAAEVAWGDDRHVEQRREIFAKKKALFLHFFDQQGWTVLGRDATLYLWLRVPGDEDAQHFALRLLDKGIVVSPGSMFSVGAMTENYVRLAMVPDIESCHKALSIWKAMI
ncbi:MAG: pyridoxal phosphate-dependent aminotransferase [Myxococcota bacterium]|nr:pyridoxal phosphate-dependent aminotransferase [Myxococcota bacterium]